MIFRITLITTTPSTSDDVYRYLWEGKVLYNGYNPYEYPPESQALEHLHSDKLPEFVTFKHMTAVYPAAAQLIFYINYFFSGENDTALKLIYLVSEVITIMFILLLLRLKNKNQLFVILYAWLPLPVMEFFINSHIDAVGIAFFVMFIYFIEKDKLVHAAIPFALGILIKLYPIIFFPLLIKKIGFKKSLLFGLTSGLIILIFTLPFIPHESSINDSLSRYLSKWSFNGSFFRLFYLIGISGELARSINLVLFVILVGVIASHYHEFTKAVYAVWICFIMFSATLYPWYLGWIAAVNPLYSFASINTLFFTINFSNFTPLGDEWHEYLWVYLIEYLPFYLLLIYDISRNVSIKKYFRNF
ncbi:MAG: glycosyltransferase 87 family protein [Melioribacteraceae bacterium]|nr:glycosyltransferase 87 family protein [Melioribacteraceae bacterium]MCF8396198.1 glycosyltransferase 87 family protein [Melioribacteraceae bacterium]MCF8420540.1 glycosyltransferase 87 family protein [Melioribacteraceae bacterium]